MKRKPSTSATNCEQLVQRRWPTHEDGLLVLVVDDPSSESSELLGILSPFDLL
jgi:hypothetical protein